VDVSVRRVIQSAGIVFFAAVGTPRGQEPSIADVMARVGAYAAAFEHQLSNIVAEERYVQDIRQVNLMPGRFAAESHRELRSDVLLVQPGGTGSYVAFRDVFEVDGKPVRDRQDRLTALFLDPSVSADAQIQRINQESARYNIGNIERTINTPTLALHFLLPENQPRFRFTRSVRNASPRARGIAVPPGAWAIDFEEMGRPTLIRTPRGLGLPARGRLWTEPATGRLLITELVTEDTAVRATIDVRYQSDRAAAVMIPAEMRERYEGRRDGAVIEGSATYGNTRQFQVRSAERIGRSAVESPVSQPEATGAGSAEHPTADIASTSRDPVPLPAIPAPAAAQAPQKPQTFKAGTELVLVDFVVTDKADRPVRGLSAKDFVVREDGRERAIVSFEAFGGDVPAVAAPTPIRAGERPAPPTQPGASTVILVDDGQLSLQQAARLRPALKALLARVGDSGGSVMLVAPESGVSVLVQPTAAGTETATIDRIAGHRVEEHSDFPIADAEALAIARGDIRVLARVAARFSSINPELTAEQANAIARELANKEAHDARARRDVMYDAVLVCLDWLGGRPGRHSLVVVSAGFASDPDDAKYYDVVTRSLRANAPIHFLDARGLQGVSRYNGVEYGAGLGRNADEGPFGWAQAAEGSMDLAEETGGIAVANSNDMEQGLGRLLDTMTAYYVIAYEPPPHTKPGYRRIKIDIRTRGLHVRARRGYFSKPSGTS
jgi:VWFA-related protein